MMNFGDKLGHRCWVLKNGSIYGGVLVRCEMQVDTPSVVDIKVFAWGETSRFYEKDYGSTWFFTEKEAKDHAAGLKRAHRRELHLFFLPTDEDKNVHLFESLLVGEQNVAKERERLRAISESYEEYILSHSDLYPICRKERKI